MSTNDKRTVEPTRMQRLAITSTLQVLHRFDSETEEMRKKHAELEQQLSSRSAIRAKAAEEVEAAWAEIQAEYGIPSDIGVTDVEWQQGGSFKVGFAPKSPAPRAGEAKEKGSDG